MYLHTIKFSKEKRLDEPGESNRALRHLILPNQFQKIPQYFLSQQDDSQRSLYCTCFFFQVIQEIIEGGVNHSKGQ